MEKARKEKKRIELMTRLGTVLLMHEGSSWTACSLAKTNLLSKKYMGHKKGRYTLIMWVGSFQCCVRSDPSAYFLFLFFFYYPVLSPFTITTASGDPICHIIFGGITTQRGKKNFDLFLSFTKQGCYTFIFFSGVLFCYPLLPWFCWPFPFSPFCSYRLTFITASTHALSSNHRSHHQSSSLACLEVTYPRFFSFLICFPIMHGTTTIHEKC